MYEATEAGWSGPPFDPFALAKLRGIDVVPAQSVVDAAIVPRQGGGLQIQYNPDQPRARQRYSVAHELAHALFPDVAKQARFRASGKTRTDDDWQLELLCNLAAAELLMPVGSLSGAPDRDVGIDDVLDLRKRFEVSVEAVALRLVRLSQRPMMVFAAAPARLNRGYRLDYVMTSRRWSNVAALRQLTSGVVAQCTAVGHTAKGYETFAGQDARVEAVGIPPYPGYRLPRVVGVVRPVEMPSSGWTSIEYIRGDATDPRGAGSRIVVQIVNDKTANWGGGFALEVRKRWPNVQEDFRAWVADIGELELGTVRLSQAAPDIWVASIVAMHGYGPSRSPRIRYHALESGLAQIRDYALARGASVHAPRIGAGQARGSWPVVAGLLEESLSSAGVPVTIYDLPNALPPPPPDAGAQLALELRSGITTP